MLDSCCAFTGHRPHKFPWRYNETDGRCVALKAALTEQITALMKTGITDFFSGCADGADCWTALIVLDLRKENPALKLHCILPHEGQADRWSNSAQERYHLILKQADSVEYVSREYYDGCMLDRNHQLVDSAGVLLAVYNGERRGGTDSTVNYARKLGRKIIVINPVTLHISHEGSVLEDNYECESRVENQRNKSSGNPTKDMKKQARKGTDQASGLDIGQAVEPVEKTLDGLTDGTDEGRKSVTGN